VILYLDMNQLCTQAYAVMLSQWLQ